MNMMRDRGLPRKATRSEGRAGQIREAKTHSMAFGVAKAEACVAVEMAEVEAVARVVLRIL